ncbi:hypothetical protein ACGFZS_21040 [Streptomyces sp. NPDC048288]|uniref:hypothetical protein n=1 Tax=Streptomyces sp. NPDC048288 TaxID=3365529 RepID=UPI00371FC03A
MTRYVHHQLMGAAMAVCACVISAPVVFGVRGIPAVDDDALWLVPLGVFGSIVFFGILGATRLKVVGEVRLFEAAVPLEDPGMIRPVDRSFRHNLVSTSFLCSLLLPALVMGLALSPWLTLVHLPLALDWLIRAGIAARWEKRHGVLLWRGYVPDRPWELSYSSSEAAVQR